MAQFSRKKSLLKRARRQRAIWPCGGITEQQNTLGFSDLLRESEDPLVSRDTLKGENMKDFILRCLFTGYLLAIMAAALFLF